MLTREEILSMPVGRELDALVGQHVMGLEIVPNGLKFEPRYYLPEYDRIYHRSVPNYSTDISAAWEIIKKMREKGFDVVIESLSDSLNAGGDIYHASFFTRLEGDYAEHDSTISFEHAISICALLAVIES